MSQTLSASMLLAVPLAPLAGSVLAGIWGTAFGGNKIGRGGSHTLTIAGVLIAFILSAITFNSVIFDGARFDQSIYTWMEIGGLKITLLNVMADRMKAISTPDPKSTRLNS